MKDRDSKLGRRLFAATTIALMLSTTAGSASAQPEAADPARTARQREALRRTQEALKQAQEQQATLLAEKTRAETQWDAERAKLVGDVQKTRRQSAAAQSEVSTLRAEATRLAAERATQQQQASAALGALQARHDELARRLEQSERSLAERTRTVASITALTERATQALGAAEQANRALYAWGRKAIEELRSSSTLPVGFAQIQLENRAEALRDQLDALRLPAAK